MELNAEQRQAVEAPDGPLMIIAGPGTGKTKTLTARVGHLVASGRARPEQILALTFTKKAAEEMQQRVAALLPGKRLPRVSTFHALCHELLGGELVFIPEADRLAIVKGLPRPAPLKQFSARELSLLISRAKNKADDDPAVTRLAQTYDDRLGKQGYIDFDDLLLKTRDLLQHDEARRQEVQQRFTHVLVDEFQDTNRLQYELLHLLCGHDNIFVIGDPNQSIYGFRGASGDIFSQFASDFPRHQTVRLAVNYRSAPEIVGLSNAVFGDRLQAAGNQHGTVRAVKVLNEYSEANWVVSEIQKAIGGSDFAKAISDDDRRDHKTLRDFAVLYRSRSAAMAVRRVLEESGLPYQVVGDGSPYDQPHTQAIIGALKEHTASASPLSLAKEIVGELALSPTHDIQQFLNTLARFDTVSDALTYIANLAEQQFYDPNADAVSLLTIHAAKGLEFAHVFLIGAEDGLLPYTNADEQEESRLFYVAVSRAKVALDITYSTHRGGKQATPSPFVTRIPRVILPSIVDPALHNDQQKVVRRQFKRRQATLF